VFAQSIDQNIRQGDIAAACLGLRLSEPDAVRLGAFQRLADFYNLPIQVNSTLAERQHLGQSHAR
jgi:hypothetical protein